ncbi:hypothetical protein [Streptomyces avicenniae]|uniref:hypothetical protein n=1 Tax=Streptomyces avicenniae TaxID=500153 RepID=UPI00069CB416|nr:hypothetical protein [Streptomyces avicenniae]
MEAGPREHTDGTAPAPVGGTPPLPELPSMPPLLPDDPDPEPDLADSYDDAPADGEPPGEGPEGTDVSYADLRPPRRLRLALFAPIVLLSLLGSLMFAFPLAFAFDDAGAVVAMLGLLIGCSAAGWGMMAARRAGYTWPGLPPRGSGRRPDWRLLALYGVGLGVFAFLAVWRVAGLR